MKPDKEARSEPYVDRYEAEKLLRELAVQATPTDRELSGSFSWLAPLQAYRRGFRHAVGG
jgi:hypothetical protein